MTGPPPTGILPKRSRGPTSMFSPPSRTPPASGSRRGGRADGRRLLRLRLVSDNAIVDLDGVDYAEGEIPADWIREHLRVNLAYSRENALAGLPTCASRGRGSLLSLAYRVITRRD